MESGGAPRRSDEEEAAADCVATCPECKKRFVSRKAMHGHLKSHPERNYRGADPYPIAKLAKTETPAAAAAGGDGGLPSVVVNTNFLALMTEHEGLQSKKLIKMRRASKDETGGNGECSTSAGVAPPRECECFVCRKRFSSHQALGGHMNVHTRSGTNPLMEAKELPVLSDKEWIAVYALKRLREAVRSAPPPGAARPPLAFDLNQLPPAEAEGEEKN